MSLQINATAFEVSREIDNFGFNGTEQDDWDESEDSDKVRDAGGVM